MHGFRRSALRAAREGVIHELFKIDPLRPRQLARRLHDRLEPLKRRLLHHGRLVPRVDGAVARRHALKYVERGVRELRGDGLGHLTVRVGENPLLRPRDGVCEALHHVRLTEPINPFNPAAQHGLNQLTQMGLSPEQAKVWVANEITRQGFLLGFNELFWLASIAFIGLAGLVWLSTPINKKIR